MKKREGNTTPLQDNSWWMRQIKNTESYPALAVIFAGVWSFVLQPAIAKDFTTKEEFRLLKESVTKIETEYKNNDVRIEKKIDQIGNKIDSIYKLLIEMK